MIKKENRTMEGRKRVKEGEKEEGRMGREGSEEGERGEKKEKEYWDREKGKEIKTEEGLRKKT